MATVAVSLISIEDIATAHAKNRFPASLLTNDDRDHIARQPTPEKQAATVATRIALRLTLSKTIGIYASRQPITLGARGRPMLPHGSGAFSISHTDRTALVGVCTTGSIGVDLETLREISMPDRRRAGLVAAAGAICQPHLPEDVVGVLQGWTRLEATAKARGSGIGQLLVDLGVWGGADAQLSPTAIRQRCTELIAAESIDVQDLDLPPELFGAIALTDPSPGPVTVDRVSAAQLVSQAVTTMS